MSTLETSAFAVCWVSANDSFNLFHPLPEATVDGGAHHLIHCGINLSYDLAKSIQEMQVFDLPPPDVPEAPDKGGSSESDNSESSASMDTDVEI
jgi:hypothetical protein